ncbi:MAG: U32 family peptidase C-terminal domain-containing protein, partial [Lachnospiraceae bacterium]|nr:U32 family peptidase C-terminal domain-containing protein [Lachnospiraceae bacterium]
GDRFGARAYAENFARDGLAAGINYAHLFGRRVYLTVNTLVKEKEFAGLYDYLAPLYEIGLDGVIVQDIGVLKWVREQFPQLPLHASTQMNITHPFGAQLLRELGVVRVVPARELSLSELRSIKETVDIELETFIHGAMCISYSGRCLLSNYFTGRDANRGACTHPCRWKYAVMEEQRPGEYLPVYENERGTYIFNSKDLCMIEHLPDLIDAGIDSFKIEGRMKTALYVATVARTYRRAIDDYFISPATYEKNMDWYLDQISNCTYRQFTTGFFYPSSATTTKPEEQTQIYDNNTYIKEYTYLGIIEGKNEAGLYQITQKNKFSVGEAIEIMKPGGKNVAVVVKQITDEQGQDMAAAPHPKQILYVDVGEPLEKYDILRKKEE